MRSEDSGGEGSGSMKNRNPITRNRLLELEYLAALEELREARALQRFGLPSTIRRTPTGMSHSMAGEELGVVAAQLAEEPSR